jgi:hypothetical protein
LLLKFVTGRDLLPAHPKSETIYIETGDVNETTVEYAHNVGRLPAAHTCTNALQIPNYLEALVFGADDEACKVTVGWTWKEKLCAVTTDIKQTGWSKLSPAIQKRLRLQAVEILLSKITTSAGGTESYDLDENDYGTADDDDDDARRRSSVMRGIPPKRRRNTAEIIERRSGSTASAASNPGGLVAARKPTVVAHVPDEDDYEDPFEDPGVAVNPFAIPGTDSPPPDDARRGTAVPTRGGFVQRVAYPGAHNSSSEFDSGDEPPQESSAPAVADPEFAMPGRSQTAAKRHTFDE